MCLCTLIFAIKENSTVNVIAERSGYAVINEFKLRHSLKRALKEFAGSLNLQIICGKSQLKITLADCSTYAL